MAVIARIMRLVAGMAWFVIIMGMPMIVVATAVIQRTMAIQYSDIYRRNRMEMKLRTHWRRQQQGQRDHSEEKRSNRLHASLFGRLRRMRKPENSC